MASGWQQEAECLRTPRYYLRVCGTHVRWVAAYLGSHHAPRRKICHSVCPFDHKLLRDTWLHMASAAEGRKREQTCAKSPSVLHVTT